MRTKIYVKANSFVNRVVELYNCMCELHEVMCKKGIFNANYFDACIRTYAFKFSDSLVVSTLNTQSSIYHELAMFGDMKPLMKRGGYKMNLRDHEGTNEFSTVNNSEEHEFQLLMIHDEHELYQNYVKEKIRERIPEVNSIFLASMDIRRLNPAIKAAKELIDGYNSKPDKHTNPSING